MPPNTSISVIPSSCRRSVPPTTSDASSKSSAMVGLIFRTSARMARSTAPASDWEGDMDTTAVARRNGICVSDT